MQRISTTTAAPVGTTTAAADRSAGFLLALAIWRGAVTLHALLVLTQPVSIGQYLSGVYDFLGVHDGVAIGVLAAGALTGLSSIGYAVAGGRRRVLVGCLPLFFVEGLQIGMGHAGNLAVHIPLGVTIVLVALALAAYAWSRPAGQQGHRR